jgi:hypothetical protein
LHKRGERRVDVAFAARLQDDNLLPGGVRGCLPTSSAANAGNRSNRPSAQRYSIAILRPST